MFRKLTIFILSFGLVNSFANSDVLSTEKYTYLRYGINGYYPDSGRNNLEDKNSFLENIYKNIFPESDYIPGINSEYLFKIGNTFVRDLLRGLNRNDLVALNWASYNLRLNDMSNLDSRSLGLAFSLDGYDSLTAKIPTAMKFYQEFAIKNSSKKGSVLLINSIIKYFKEEKIVVGQTPNFNKVNVYDASIYGIKIYPAENVSLDISLGINPGNEKQVYLEIEKDNYIGNYCSTNSSGSYYIRANESVYDRHYKSPKC